MRRLTKSRSQKILDGVLGGIGEYFGIDPVILRLLYLIFAFTVHIGLAVVLYIAAMFVMPQNDGSEITAGKAPLDTNKLIGGLLIVLGMIILFNRLFDSSLWAYFRQLADYFWAAALIFAGVYLIFRGGKPRVQ